MNSQNISYGILNDRYVFQWAGRCQFQSETERSDKVWGWFYYKDPTASKSFTSTSDYPFAYVFWGPTGKTLKFKKHINSTYDLNGMTRKKIVHKYEQIGFANLVSLWEDLHETVNNKFIFHLLANDI